ncbi:PTS cellobiose transporter subunit IIA [Lacticaseibacillus chiayiensis]|uniref:PTS cellobiose transporter subunit IIA n=1 Tax=Lacticaseibacillus chiayiensis TaxID=2100821 RepID=A0A4Q1TK43_9LACO|nr:PTS cellobiose transporter subunit IIA [Lacticaseibacillus chiayiensis]QVI35240.1 PTS cellobiose transporter subunit IIA [Lacticaseibacillus chiayiensis]RXT18899.1 PTS cellobiose transporter subunit IIA [Lacticaseibacillus chiayiensis]RXT58220.1 PTS cellobiose transporter subunit IIA [Lacticaseibacillus chiayiensis]UYN57021.1 PTS cellobiose transporter subunit IIA [Lacticaseibacillus chiayiensis]
MNSDDIQLIAFEIILHSGNSRTMIHEAFAAMRVGNFDKADERLKASNDELLLAHQSQSDLLKKYASGTKIEMEIILVHAQDHLMTTMTLREVALEMEHLYRNQAATGELKNDESENKEK